MKVIVDTSVWSLVLRRSRGLRSRPIEELRSLIRDYRVQMLGPIRQEILSGVRDQFQFEQLLDHLASFPDLPILTEDYITAARFFNLCRSKGVQGSNTDFLICAVAVRYECSIYTTDKDFEMFAQHLSIMLHKHEGLQ